MYPGVGSKWGVRGNTAITIKDLKYVLLETTNDVFLWDLGIVEDKVKHNCKREE